MFAIVPADSKRRLICELGPYTVWHDPLVHRPYGLFRIWRGERYVGGQISYPCLSDAEHLERLKEKVVQVARAVAAHKVKMRGVAKWGRPKKHAEIPVLAET